MPAPGRGAAVGPTWRRPASVRRGIARSAVAVLLALAAGAAPATEVELAAGTQRLRVALEGGLPVHWESCATECAAGGGERVTLVSDGGGDGGVLRWDARDAAARDAAARTAYTAELRESPEAVALVLTAPLAGRTIVYELPRSGHALRLRVATPPGVGLAMATGAGFVPPPMPGFGAAFSGVEAVRVDVDGQRALEPAAGAALEERVAPGAWLGIRRRFWAWIARPADEATAQVAFRAADRPAVIWAGAGGQLDLEFYAGPVEWKSLRVVAPELGGMLFASLWEPLRWLCFGLFFLLAAISAGVGNAGVAIMLLSLAVKIILWPLTRVAERWQQEVNRMQGRIQPRIAAIRREFRGEEAHDRTLQVYRDEGVHPMFTLKSLAGFAIQVPMFIAAFDMLADNYALAGAGFLWIGDLSAPDRFARLPFAVPFFGAELNVLPAVMTLLTGVSAWAQRDASLTPELLRRQQRQLYLMAGAFFLLFYTFPAGMVLYWTANNAWHLVKMQAGAWLERRR
jgi:YidC/Oxa1 family membrane protein insertase